MRKICIFLSILAVVFTMQAQDGKLRVAVFDPSSSGTPIDEGTKVAVRELISSTFVNTGKYNIVERSLLQQIMKEQAFSNTDVVDDSQATQLGKLAGANKVVLSIITQVGERNMLSIKIIDVKTATIDQQKTKMVTSNDLLDVVELLTREVMGEQVSYQPTQSAQKQDKQKKSFSVKSLIPQKKGEKEPKQPKATKEKSATATTPAAVTPMQQSSGASIMSCGLEIMATDLPGKFKWNEARQMCPQGWRLPTSQELECLCDNEKHIGGFYGKQYWSNEAAPKKSDKAISRTLNNSKVKIESISSDCSCRCVR